jgi:hypothetical protein
MGETRAEKQEKLLRIGVAVVTPRPRSTRSFAQI